MTRAPRGLSARRFVRALELDGFELRRVLGSRRFVVAYHALSDTFPIGTLRGMIADAGWKDEDLRRLELVE